MHDVRVAAVGDIHGHVDKLRRLLADPRLAGRPLVFLGDLVNRGPNSRAVLESICELVAQGKASVLLGNHDEAFLNYLESGAFLEFALAGGIPTILSYATNVHGDVHRQLVSAVPGSHVRLLKGAALYWEERDFVLCHAGISPLEPSRRDKDTLLRGPGAALFANSGRLPKLCVCGHYVQEQGQPFVSDRLICIDTGCGVGGPLTAVLLPERKFVQA